MSVSITKVIFFFFLIILFNPMESSFIFFISFFRYLKKIQKNMSMRNTKIFSFGILLRKILIPNSKASRTEKIKIKKILYILEIIFIRNISKLILRKIALKSSL